MKKRTGFVFLALLITLGILAVLALGIGSTYIPPGQILEGFFKENRMARVIVVGLRLPRVLLAIMIGMALSLAGALLQAVMRNPLADPGIIGVSAGAAAAATSVMLLFPRWLSLVPLVAFVGAFCLRLDLPYGLAPRHRPSAHCSFRRCREYRSWCLYVFSAAPEFR